MTIATLKNFTPGFIFQSKGAGTTLAELEPALTPGFIGAFVDLPWAAIEPSRGTYDFSLIRSYLAWGANNGRQLFFMLADRDFSRSAATSRIVPRWVESAPFNKKRADGGCVARIWTTPVNDARITLIHAIMREFAEHPQFEALSLQETALGGISSASDEDYNHDDYCDQICRLIRAVAPALGRVQLWQSINWLGPADGPYLDRIAGAMAMTGAGGLTNPDTVPWNRKKPMYGVMRAWADRLPVALGGDTSQLDRPGGEHYATFADLLEMLLAFALEHGAHYLKVKGSFHSQVASGAALSKAYLAAVQTIVQARRLEPSIPAVLRPDDAGEGPTPALDVTAIRAWLGRLEAVMAEGKALVG